MNIQFPAGLVGKVKHIHPWLQAPHRPVRELGFAPAEAGVYVSRWHHGSPAHRYSLYALHWLTQLNGQPVPDLDAFVAIVRTLPDKSFARLKLCQLETTKTKVSFACSGLLSITVSVIEDTCSACPLNMHCDSAVSYGAP